MNGFDIRESWQEGSIFMRESEFSVLARLVRYDDLCYEVLQACNIADAAINKMMGKNEK